MNYFTYNNNTIMFTDPHNNLLEEYNRIENKNFDNIYVFDLAPTKEVVDFINTVDTSNITYIDHHLSARDFYKDKLNREKIKTFVLKSKKQAPNCTMLVKASIAKEGNNLIVTHSDADGFLSMAKAIGLSYSEIDADADILDNIGRAEQLTDFGFLLLNYRITITPYSTNKEKYFQDTKRVWQSLISYLDKSDMSIKEEIEKAVKESKDLVFSILEKDTVVYYEGKVILSNLLKYFQEGINVNIPFWKGEAIKKFSPKILIATGKGYQGEQLFIEETKRATGTLKKIFPNMRLGRTNIPVSKLTDFLEKIENYL